MIKRVYYIQEKVNASPKSKMRIKEREKREGAVCGELNV